MNPVRKSRRWKQSRGAHLAGPTSHLGSCLKISESPRAWIRRAAPPPFSPPLDVAYPPSPDSEAANFLQPHGTVPGHFLPAWPKVTKSVQRSRN